MRFTFALAAAAFAGFCTAQDTVQNDYPYTIDPETVPQSLRDYWCDQNKAQCPLICTQQPGVNSLTTLDNDCNSDSLTYSCVCENGVSPNITEYSQTLPFFICQAWGTNCVDNCNGDNTCADKCRADHPCGAQSPFLGNASLTSSASAASPTSSPTRSIPVTGFAGDPTSTPDVGGAASGTFMPSATLSMAAFVGSVFLGFAVLL